MFGKVAYFPSTLTYKFVLLTLWATWDSSSESTPQILTELHVTLASFFLLALSNYNTTLENSIHLAESRN
jgi:hypothetical protein